MKLISKFLNLIMWVVAFCIATLAEMGVWDLVALPSGTQGVITLDPTDSSKVSYFDTFRFWGQDLKSSVTREPRFAVRGWFGAKDGWQSATRWADVAVECVVGAVVPIAAPTYELNEMSKYCDWSGEGFVFLIGNASSVEQKTLRPREFVKDGSVDFEEMKSTICSWSGTYDTVYVSMWKSGADTTDPKEAMATQAELDDSKFTMSNRNTVKLYNILCKIAKYNSDEYAGADGWMQKFYSMKTENGKVVGVQMKGSAVGLYFQFYMALIFAFFFVYENPIVVERQGDGSNSVSGGLHMRWSHRKKKGREDGKR